MVTRQKVIKEREALIQGELQRIMTTVKDLRANVTTAARRDTLQKIVGLTKGPLRAMLLLPNQRKNAKMSEMSKHLLLWKRRS
ncbi:hypothetical protein Patl1_11236 [Pistacia atlantica]|uniref:Uncharacterized protein n=1 Tax=Pistacia atlantica TaxID=434234 RepID=A0ACC1A1T8_9ROSI|nr:hypothetical protein Patl1_11236 [Pistacia atlantica]